MNLWIYCGNDIRTLNRYYNKLVSHFVYRYAFSPACFLLTNYSYFLRWYGLEALWPRVHSWGNIRHTLPAQGWRNEHQCPRRHICRFLLHSRTAAAELMRYLFWKQPISSVSQGTRIPLRLSISVCGVWSLQNPGLCLFSHNWMGVASCVDFVLPTFSKM